ncbi:MAG: hypothetical protein ACYTHM_23430 [Planctomycetota bacterium]
MFIAFLLWFLVDWLFHLEWGHRLFVVLIALGGFGFFFVRSFLGRILTPMKDEDLALLLERRYPDLQCRLISAVQFEKMMVSGTLPFSLPLARIVMDQAREAVRPRAVGEVLDFGALKKSLGWALLIVILMGGFFVAFPGPGGTWFHRNLLLRDVEWPRDTYLEMEGFKGKVLHIPRGEDVLLFARVTKGVQPDKATLYFSMEGGASGRVNMTVVDEGRYKAVLKNLMERTTVYVRAGDGRTEDYRIAVVDRPEVEALEIDLMFPDYMGLPPRLLSGTGIDLSIPLGTLLRFRGQSSKDLQRAWIHLPPEDPLEGQGEGERGFLIEVRPEHGGILEIGLEDKDDLTCADPVRLPLRVIPDKAPVVGLRLMGISERITPRARIPMHIVIRDDHGVMRAELTHVVEVRKPKRETTEGRKAIPNLTRGTKDQIFEEVAEAEAYEVKPGMFLRLKVEATDGDTLKGPNVGRSETFALKVVTGEELFGEIVRRQQEQRRAFEQLIIAEEAVERVFRSLSKSLVAPEAPDMEVREGLAGMIRDQRGIQGRVSLVAEKFDQILLEMINNRLGDPKEHACLNGKIIQPLRRLAGVGMGESLDHLKHLSRARGKAEKEEAVATVGEDFRVLLRTMRKILDDMLKQESLAEIIASLKSLLEAERHLIERTKNEYQRRIEELFEDENGDKKKDKDD